MDPAIRRNVGIRFCAPPDVFYENAVADAGFADQNARALKLRWPLLALSLVSASAFALSVQAGRWWVIGDVEIGPHGTTSPFGGPSNLQWAGESARWERFGMATWAAGLIAMIVLVVVAGALAAGRVPRLAARTALVAVATATATGAAFLLARPDNGMPFELARGVPLYAVAIVTGALAALGVLRSRPA